MPAEGEPTAPQAARQTVSVVIPHYQDLDNLGRCLALLDHQTIGRDAFEVVVCDNASPVGIAAVETAVAGRAKVVVSTEKGAGPTRNAGAAAARGDVIVFLDSDCRPEPQFLAEGLKALGEHDVVGGAVEVLIETAGEPTAAEAFEVEFAFQNEKYIKKFGFSVTAALFVSRAVFDAVGPFRNGLSEDREWGNRAIEKGFSLGFAPNAVVGHPARRDWPELARKWRRLNSETFLFTREKPFGTARWLARNWVVLASTPVHLAQIAATRKLSRLSHRVGAMAILARLRLARIFWAHQVALGAIGTRGRPSD